MTKTGPLSTKQHTKKQQRVIDESAALKHERVMREDTPYMASRRFRRAIKSRLQKLVPGAHLTSDGLRAMQRLADHKYDASLKAVVAASQASGRRAGRDQQQAEVIKIRAADF